MRPGWSWARGALASGSALALLTRAPALLAAEVGWSAPDDCQHADIVTGQVERLIGRPLSPVEAEQFEVRITHVSERWQLELTTKSASGGGPSERRLEGASCAAVTEAAGVAMALAIRAGGAALTEAPADGEASDADPALDAEKTPTEPPPQAAPAPRAPPGEATTKANGRSRVSPLVGLAAQLDTATLPSAALGLAVEAGVHSSAFRVGLEGGALLPSTARLPNGESGDFSLLTGALLGCLEADLAVAAEVTCIGFELGRLSGEGRGVSNPHLGNALWQAARAELGVALPARQALRLFARVGVAVPISRPTFQLDGADVHRPAALSLRAALGVELLP